MVPPGTSDGGYEHMPKACASYPNSWDGGSQGVLGWVSFHKCSLKKRGSILHHLQGAMEVMVMVMCVALEVRSHKGCPLIRSLSMPSIRLTNRIWGDVLCSNKTKAQTPSTVKISRT